MPVEPQNLFITDIGVNGASITGKPSALQYDPHLGREVPMFGVPSDLSTVTWWSADRFGHKAPQPGSAPTTPNRVFFFGHTGIDGGVGIFDKLGTLVRGAKIGVEGHNASGQKVLLIFKVIRVVNSIDKADPGALTKSIASAPAGTRASFFTCSGSVDESISSSNFNTQVDASMVDAVVEGK